MPPRSDMLPSQSVVTRKLPWGVAPKGRLGEPKSSRIGAAVQNCALVRPAEITLHSNYVIRRDLIVPAAICASAQGDVVDIRHIWRGRSMEEAPGSRFGG